MLAADIVCAIVVFGSVVVATAARVRVSSATRAAEVPLRSGLSGADVVTLLLVRSGVSDVRLEEHESWLGDRYDPWSRTVRLSPTTYGECSLAAAASAAREAAHAIEHARGAWREGVRQLALPLSETGSLVGVVLAGAGVSGGGIALAELGAAVFGAFVLLAMGAVPGELHAARIAHRALVETAVVEPRELACADRLLEAESAHYVASALTASAAVVGAVARESVARARTPRAPT